MKTRRAISLQSHCCEFLRCFARLKYSGVQEESYHAPKAFIVHDTISGNSSLAPVGHLSVTVADPKFRIDALLTDHDARNGMRCRNTIRRSRDGRCCWLGYIMSMRWEVEQNKIRLIVDSFEPIADLHELQPLVAALPDLSQDKEIMTLFAEDRISASQAISVLGHSSSSGENADDDGDESSSWGTAVSTVSHPKVSRKPQTRNKSNKKRSSNSISSSSSSSSSNSSTVASTSSSSSSSSSSGSSSKESFRTAESISGREASPPSFITIGAFYRVKNEKAPAVAAHPGTDMELKIQQETLDILANIPLTLDSIDFSSSLAPAVEPSSSAPVGSSLSTSAFSQPSLGLGASREPRKSPVGSPELIASASKRRKSAENSKDTPSPRRSPRRSPRLARKAAESSASLQKSASPEITESALLTEESAAGARLLASMAERPQSSQQEPPNLEAFLRAARETLEVMSRPTFSRQFPGDKELAVLMKWANS